MATVVVRILGHWRIPIIRGKEDAVLMGNNSDIPSECVRIVQHLAGIETLKFFFQIFPHKKTLEIHEIRSSVTSDPIGKIGYEGKKVEDVIADVNEIMLSKALKKLEELDLFEAEIKKCLSRRDNLPLSTIRRKQSLERNFDFVVEA